MTRAAAGDRHPEAGFTLLEVLVVLFILVGTASLALPMLTRPSDAVTLRSVVQQMTGALRATRAAAILSHSEREFAIDVDKRTFGSQAIRTRSFASEIDARLTFASPVWTGRSGGGFRFFPDGSSTGGQLVLSLRGMEERLCVEWATGQVQQGGKC